MASQTVDFFVIGCQRSGTTLVRLILDTHHTVCCIDEPDSYRVVASASRRETEKALIGVKVPCLTEQFTQTTFWDRRLMLPTPNSYRGQPLIFVTRDARDTVASMRALRMGTRSWIDHSARPTILAKRRRDPYFAERYHDYLHLADEVDDDIGLAAFYWRFKTEALPEYRSRDWPVLLLQYEDLVSQPSIELRRVCTFLGIPWEPQLLEHHRRLHSDVLPSGLTTGNTNPRRSIDRTSIGKWRRIWTAAQAGRIVELAGPLQATLYPEPCDGQNVQQSQR